MNINNLELDFRYSNYKALCNALEITPKTSASKKKQIKEFESWVRYHKEGHSFIIDEIYDEQKPIFDGRGLNANSHNNQKGAYGKYIRLLVLNMLSMGEGNGDAETKNIIISGKNEMLERLNMINENYRYGSYNRKAMSHYLGMDLKFVHEFYNTNTRKMRQSVETTLNKLMNSDKLIFWNTVIMVGKSTEHREATDEEVKFIVNCENLTLKEMGAEKMEYIYASNRLDEFYIKVKRKLSQKGILFSYNAYKIIFADAVYKRNDQLIYRLGIEDEKHQKTLLNTTLYDNIGESIKHRHCKVNAESEKFMGFPPYSWLSQNNHYKGTVSDRDFVDNSQLLNEMCIDQTYGSVCEKISQEWRNKLERDKRKADSDFSKTCEDLGLNRI